MSKLNNTCVKDILCAKGIRSYSHTAFHVKDMDTILNFYCGKLGMKQKFTITTDTTIEMFRAQQAAGEAISDGARPHIEYALAHPGLPLITYVEMAQRQFLEFFYVYEDLAQPGDLAGKYGYQHLSIEVEDIHEAWDALVANGIQPDTEISMGPDRTWQFWIHDPEGNRIEMMQYTPQSLQVQ